MREYIRRDGKTVTLLWGYGYQLLIAEIVGANYDSVKNDITESDLSASSCPEEKLNKLRGKLPSALVTTYTYYPARGVASVTDPSGKKTKYEYNGFGQLTKVIGPDNKSTQSYEYKYAR